jgi:hypothetical protein
MGNRAAKFISPLVASLVAGAPLAAVSQNAPPATPNAADTASECLASPKGAAPQGQHWYYRLERGTKRQCWYLRAAGGKEPVKDGVKTSQGAPAVPETPRAATPRPETARANPAASPSVQNARAEYVAPAPAAQAPAAAEESSAQPPVTTRWPDATAPAPQAEAQPAPTPPPPSARPARTTGAVALAAAELPADKPAGSLQTLLLVIVGALALAGLIASLIYRFAGGRVRVETAAQRRVRWDHRDRPHADESRAPWRAPPAAASPRAHPRPVDFDAARPHAAEHASFGQMATQGAAARRAASDGDEHRHDTRNPEIAIDAPAPHPAVAHVDVDLHDDDDAVAPARGDDEAASDDAVDIDAITAMLERLAQEGPRLTQPSPEADPADFARSPRGQSAARA